MREKDPLIQYTACYIALLDLFSMVHSMVSSIQLLFPDTTAVWGSSVTSLTLTQVEESLSIWQLSVMKKHFWTLWACLVYLLCLWVALSSVFPPNWILCTHSHRRICISSYTRRIYLPHTHGTFAFMCLLPLCIMTARALPSHLFAFPLNPPNVWGLSLNIKRSTRRKRCGSI